MRTRFARGAAFGLQRKRTMTGLMEIRTARIGATCERSASPATLRFTGPGRETHAETLDARFKRPRTLPHRRTHFLKPVAPRVVAVDFVKAAAEETRRVDRIDPDWWAIWRRVGSDALAAPYP